MDIVIASANEGKLTEIKAVLDQPGRKFIAQSYLAISSPAETGLSFVENALIKARHAATHSGQAALADDSGLVVPYLKGAPGIHSARYAGEQATDEDNIQQLLGALKTAPEQNVDAFFYCCMVLVRHAEDPIPIICQARWDGAITQEAKGIKGFGYDPIFWVPTHHCTAAQLSLEDKNRLSHRGKALSQLADLLLFEGL